MTHTLFDYINKDINPLHTTDTIASAQEFFIDLNYSHFPVLEDNIFIGNISKEDIDILDINSTIENNKYELERFYVHSTMIWLDVLEIFAQNDTNIVPVLSEKNEYIGYYELEDVIKFFHETPFLREEGGILVIQKDVHNYSMSQITQIIESNNARVLGLFVSKIDNELVEITVKTSQSSLNEIIQTFRRFEYTIVSEHQEDSYLQNLKERSDYLDKYLNI